MTHNEVVEMLEAEWRDRLKAAVLAERDACAKICVDESWRLKKIAFEHENLQANSAAIRASILAEMIRARGQA